VVWLATPVEPCATAPPRGKEVAIADEEAVIVWDADKHVEHFIRKAAFHSNAPSFGFLVPTPTKPTLGEVGDSVFDQLAWRVAPPVRTESRGFQPGCLLLSGATDSKSAAGPAPTVSVIQTARVAGFDATTVSATDPAALAAWLGSHGFESTPELTDWLDRYVVDHWTITAFVVAADGNPSEALSTRSVLMSFPTDRPFYPYREPAHGKSEPSRSLRVYVLAKQRYQATLAGKPWLAAPFFAAAIDGPTELVAVAGEHPVATVFLDTSSPRPGTDELYFVPSRDQGELRQAEYVRYERREIPLELIPLGIIVIAVTWALARRRRRRTQ
jgi:hypothetical protein